MPITPLAFYEIYQAGSLHFRDGNYDAFKYNWKTKVSETSFKTHKNKYFFEKFARMVNTPEEAKLLVISNFIKDNKYIVQLDKKPLLDWKGYWDNLDYRFGQDVKAFYKDFDSFKDVFDEWMKEGNNDNHLFLIYLDKVLKYGLFKKLDEIYGDDVIYENFKESVLTIYNIVLQLLPIDEPRLLKILITNRNPNNGNS